jgi:hypothetical protein
LYNNTLNDLWVVVMYFQTADKNEDINFRLNQLTYYRDPIAIANVYKDGSLTLPIATLIMMQLKAQDYLVATCVGQTVSPRLLKKVVRDFATPTATRLSSPTASTCMIGALGH